MPKNYYQQNSYYCSKLRSAYKEMGGRQAISGPWSNSNCYLFYNKSFESQTEAENFCRYAFGAEYRGKLAYGIGISNFSPLETNENNGKNPYHGMPGWKYLKFDILSEDSICQCSTNGNEYIALRNDTLCPMPMQKQCSTTLYDISTVCELSELTYWFTYGHKSGKEFKGTLSACNTRPFCQNLEKTPHLFNFFEVYKY